MRNEHPVFAVLLAIALSGASTAAKTQGALQEITITAQKREERLQDVPISVSAFSAEQISAANIESTQDLRFLVPSLQYTMLAAFATPYLRGIGTDVVVPNADPSVATYVDGVFVAGSFGQILNMLAIERVQVLKGPQGTLYGRNAVGGAIDLVTMTPTTESFTELSVGVGDYSRREGHAYVSGPLSDNFYAGAYLAGSWRDSTYRDVGPAVKSQRNTDDEANWGGRIKLVYSPSELLTLVLSAERISELSGEAAAARQGQANGLGYVFGASGVPAPHVLTTDFGAYNKAELDAMSLREELNFSWGEILGISAYRNMEATQYFDADSTSAPVAAIASFPNRSRSLSQELQYISPIYDKAQWVVGAFYYSNESAYAPTAIFAPILFPAAGIPPIQMTNATVDTYSIAGFGELKYALTDNSNVTLGARYTRERKRAFGLTVDRLNALGGTPLLTTIHPDSEKTWSQFTPRIVLDRRVGDTLFYASYNKGFKSGVYNITDPSPTAIGPVNPEILDAYEIGAKSEFMDHRIRLNTAAYLYELKDLQIYVSNVETASRATLKNAAAARAYGLETELTAAITDRFALNGAVSWEHGTYTKFVDFSSFAPAVAGNRAIVVDVTGDRMQRAPAWAANLNAEYIVPVATGSVGGRIGVFYNGEFYWTPNNAGPKEDAYATVDVSITYRSSKDRWRLNVWGRNVTDEHYRNAIHFNAYGTSVNDGLPRMYGANATFTF